VNVLRLWEWEALQHPHYSCELSPYDYDLISRLKQPLRCKQFAYREDTESSAARGGKVNASADADGFRRLPHPWQ
jgi:hypothetical protein